MIHNAHAKNAACHSGPGKMRIPRDIFGVVYVNYVSYVMIVIATLPAGFRRTDSTLTFNSIQSYVLEMIGII